MRNINSRVTDPSSFISNPGSRVHEILEPRFDGISVNLVTVGSEDIQERIEAFAPYTDINFMLSRLKVGDRSVLASRPALYGDFSNLPSDPITALNIIQTAEQTFSKLSVDEKQNYNNDFRVWLASLFSGSSSLSFEPNSNNDRTVSDVPSVDKKDGDNSES